MKRDLEERTFLFAKRARGFVQKLLRNVITRVDGAQLIRSSGSVGANYIEAQEALSKKDFSMRVKICRKEVKESRYWLALFAPLNGELEKERLSLFKEADELLKIFCAIVNKVSQ